MNNKDREEIYLSCIDYFQKRKPYKKAFEIMRRKWKQYGRVAGIIEIGNPSREEREILGGFLGKDFFFGSIRFSMAEFENALKETRFGEIPVGELLCGYFGEELITNKAERYENARKKKGFFRELSDVTEKEFGKESDSFVWISRMINQKKYGYQLIVNEYTRSPEETMRHVAYVCQAAEFLKEKQGVRLAVLGAKITRNPHAYDRNTLAGKLLIQALSCVKGDMACKSAEDILMLYYAAGIRPDDISSFTAVYGIHLYTKEGEHPAYQSFIGMGESCVVTLSNLAAIKRADAKSKKVFVIENQMVFSHLCEALKGQEAALMCTSGQLKTASLILLDLLSESGCEIYYSGDFDPEGIDIAEKILTRNSESTHLWCMTREDYRKCISNEEISEERLRKLDRIKLPCFADVKEEILKNKKAGYQEQLIGEMLRGIAEKSKA